MAHDHASHAGHDHSQAAADMGLRNLFIAFAVNTFFAIIEFVGGYFTHSLAIMSDAFHDLGDSVALGLAWFAALVATRPASTRFT